MNAEKLGRNLPKALAGVTTLLLSATILNGYNALEANNEVIRTDAIAETYRAVGYPNEAAYYESEATLMQKQVDDELLRVKNGLLSTALMAFGAFASLKAGRRENSQNQHSTQ